MRDVLKWASLLRARFARLTALPAALLPAVAFYQGSWRLAMRRVYGVFRREGVRGIIRRAHILTGRPLSDDFSSAGALYGDVLPLAPDFRPLVSVIVPNFNHANYLRQRLDSIYSQTYPNIEVILLDDCSTDGSALILTEYAGRHPDKTICHLNESNSGGVFNQWKKGLELATGSLVWIAESDDYCSDNFLEEMVRCFQTGGVKLAFADTKFVRGTPPEAIWTLSDYLADLKLRFTEIPFIRSAHAMVNSGWVVKNLVPNVSSAVFRHPGDMALFNDEEWLGLRLCGDWIFYLSIIRGGLVGYNPNATNFYRQHVSNTSVRAQKQDVYYREHEIVAKALVEMYRLDDAGLKRQEQLLYNHWCINRGDSQREEFRRLYNLERILPAAQARKPNLLMAVYALAAGGGETFPVMLGNLMQQANFSVTLLNCGQEPTEEGVKSMVSAAVPIIELDHLERIALVCADMGIELVHSHHAWVDMSLATLLLGRPDIKQVVSTHGMYEMMTVEQVRGLMPLLRGRVDAFVYTAEKNLAAFPQEIISDKVFAKIDNALPAKSINAVSLVELGIAQEDFVVCLVARAIPEKGWAEAIEAVELANRRSGRKIHLLLIGTGPEFDRLHEEPHADEVHFLGFRPNIRDYFSASDLGFLPSRFKGESAPLVLIDCLLAGKPVLASNIGEIQAMLSTPFGLAGELFDLVEWEINVPALAEKIVTLANDQVGYQSIFGCVSAAAVKFEVETMVQKYVDVYETVLKDGKTRLGGDGSTEVGVR
jgi:glycosyltransferase involved in cell wall biosynthesis